MQKEITISFTPKQAGFEDLHKKIIAKKLEISEEDISSFHIEKKSIDARNANVKINIKFQVFINEEHENKKIEFVYPSVKEAKEVIVVGSGPAGLFAALRLIELGLKPIVFERGKDVKERKKDIALLNRNVKLDPESNYSFGEGGAGTFSDGKLYTRSKKRGNHRKIIEVLNFFGAQDDVLTNAHPHIGTDKLPSIIANIRNQIISSGGEFHFSAKVSEYIIENNEIKGVIVNGEKHFAEAVILATGHSARDVYFQLHKQNVALESKAFAVGVRVEHKQDLINDIQYHCSTDIDYLPSASYVLKTQINGRGVYSFCMCPGGFIIPSATEKHQIVVNGMSPSHRSSKYANSGIVVEVKLEDLSKYKAYGVMAGLKFQEELEQLAFENADKDQKAPAQRLRDFVEGKPSVDLPESSYFPGIIASPLHEWLPNQIYTALKKGFKEFDKKMKNYINNDAVVLGVETRTSAPVKIPRDSETLEHIQIKNLYPCGEGSGYAGGIVSAAVDGERCAEKIYEKINIH